MVKFSKNSCGRPSVQRAPPAPSWARLVCERSPSAWGLRRRRPGTVLPNEVIFMRRDVCGKVKGSGRKGNRETRLAGGKGTVHFSDCFLTLGWGGMWEGKDPGWWRGERGRRGWGWPSLGLAKLQGLGLGLHGGSVRQSPGPPRAQLQCGPNYSWEGVAPAPHRG